MKFAQPAVKVFFFAVVISAAAFFLYLVDDDLGLGWPNNVVRNWQQFGMFQLHGQLVFSPGGFDIANHPQVYKGMSPMFLVPVYVATGIFSWTGLDTLSFHILLLCTIVGGCWSLLGRDNFALLAAAVFVLCPGYMRPLKVLGPDALSALPVIPYAAIALAILKKPKFTPALALALLILTLGFMSLNWTAAWVCGPFLLFVLGLRGLNRRALFFLATLMVIGVPAIAVVSVAVKYGGAAGQSGSVLANYTWGNSGYGGGLSTGRAFLRLAFYNGISLFPMWLLFIYAVWQRARSGARFSWLAFAPLAMSVADLVIMRNYFGHHPPMAGAVLLAGLIFSLALLRVPGSETSKEITMPFQFVTVLAVLSFAYALAFLVFFRANEANMLSLGHLIRQHTARSDTIVILKSDAATAAMADRLEEPMDRRIIVVDDLNSFAAEKSHWVILSPVKLDDSLELSAQSAAHSQGFLNGVADWFNRSIAKRNPGDRLDVADTYFLYEPKVAHPLPNP
jgi:hypothetical protein